MSLQRRLFDVLKTLQSSSYRVEKNVPQAEYHIQDLLLTVFKIVQKQELLTSKEILEVQDQLSNSFDEFKYLIDVLAFRYSNEKLISFLTYRSGLQFLTVDLDKLSRDKFAINEEYMNKCLSLSAIIKELDQSLEPDIKAPPFGAYDDLEDVSNIPRSHTWWRDFR